MLGILVKETSVAQHCTRKLTVSWLGISEEKTTLVEHCSSVTTTSSFD